MFVVPIEKEVNRKAAAKSVGEKTVDMIHVRILQRSRAISAELQPSWNEKKLSGGV